MFLLAGYFFKAQCIGAFNERAYTRLCYNDIQPLFGLRLFTTGVMTAAPERVFPYVEGSHADTDGDGEPDALVDGAIEYPVLTGLFMYATGGLADDGDEYLTISALFLLPFGLLAAVWLEKMSGRRALMWAAAPALVLYAFHNWDLLVVAAAVAGLYLWSRGSPLLAAAAFGAGAALKMYPAFFLAPLFFCLLYRREPKRAFLSAAVGFGTLIAINLPFALANPDGWYATYGFHRLRGPNFDTIWCAMRGTCLEGSQWEPSELNLLTAALTALFFAGALIAGWMLAARRGAYPFLGVAGSMLAAFLLWNKVHSPQYTLWLLPFFVVLRVNIFWWIAYALADLAVYVGVFRWFHSFGDATPGESAFYENLMNGGVWARAALLLALTFVFLMARASALGPDLDTAGDREPLEPHPDPEHVATAS